MERQKSDASSSASILSAASSHSQSLRRRRCTSAERKRPKDPKSPLSKQSKKAFDRRQSIPKKPPSQKARKETAPSTGSQKKSLLFTALNPYSCRRPAQIYKIFISAIVLIDLILFILSTEQHLAQRYATVFHVAEGIASCIFLVEYMARLVVCMESKRYRNMSPLAARLQFAMTWPALVDLVSCLPFFMGLSTGLHLPTLTYLRFFRTFRILKTEGSSRAVLSMYRVVYFNREILYVALLMCLLLILVTAVLLYYLRPSNSDDAPDFRSILATLYLSTLMLTGQGGPSGDLPWYTKLVVLISSVFSVAMFAIPASMLTWGFEAEAERMAKQARQRFLKQSTPFSSSRSMGSNTSDDDDFSSGGYSTDEEYFKLIAGADDENEDESKAGPKKALLMKEFEKADTSRDGVLTFREFAAMSLNSLSGMGGAEGPASTALEANLQTLARLEALEKRVQASCDRLDHVLELILESQQKRHDKSAG